MDKHNEPDLRDETALGRPGPLPYTPAGLAAGMPDFSDAAFTRLARETLAPTGGRLVFYEQARMLLIKVSGGSLVEGERLRKALATHDAMTLASLRPRFVEGAVAAGVARIFAENYWNLFLALARWE